MQRRDAASSALMPTTNPLPITIQNATRETRIAKGCVRRPIGKAGEAPLDHLPVEWTLSSERRIITRKK